MGAIDSPSWPTPQRLYAYCDETTFDGAEGTTYGAGVLLLDGPLAPTLVDEALAALAADPERTSRDDQTLARGYFHASADSKNAHSHLCRAIAARLEGTFLYSYTREGPSLFVRYRRPPTEDDHLSTTFSRALLYAVQHTRDLKVIVERRNPGTEHFTNRAIENLHWNAVRGIYDQPNLPVIFSRPEVRVVGKSEPGVQVADFLLWASNRALARRPDPTWRDRVRPRMHIAHSFKDTPEHGGDMVFKRLIMRQVEMYPSASLPVGEPEEDEFWQAVALAERVLHWLAPMDLPEHVAHLAKRLRAIVAALEAGPVATHDTMEEAARLYIMLFDTLPIYAGFVDREPAHMRRLLMARRMAALRLRKDLLHGVRAMMEARIWRADILEGDPRSRIFFPE
jgi:hypothetical protein